MPSAEYLRRQADICLRLSLAASDTDSANRLIMMAEEYKLRAAEAEAEPASLPAQPKDPSPNRATGSAVVQQQQQQQQQQPSGGATPGPADRQPEEP